MQSVPGGGANCLWQRADALNNNKLSLHNLLYI